VRRLLKRGNIAVARAADVQPAVNQKAKPPDRIALIYRCRLFRRYERRRGDRVHGCGLGRIYRGIRIAICTVWAARFRANRDRASCRFILPPLYCVANSLKMSVIPSLSSPYDTSERKRYTCFGIIVLREQLENKCESIALKRSQFAIKIKRQCHQGFNENTGHGAQ